MIKDEEKNSNEKKKENQEEEKAEERPRRRETREERFAREEREKLLGWEPKTILGREVKDGKIKVIIDKRRY